MPHKLYAHEIIEGFDPNSVHAIFNTDTMQFLHIEYCFDVEIGINRDTFSWRDSEPMFYDFGGLWDAVQLMGDHIMLDHIVFVPTLSDGKTPDYTDCVSVNNGFYLLV